MNAPPDLSLDDPEAIREHLIAAGHPRHLVCDGNCRFVMEGYPESGNTLAADLLHVLNPGLQFAHHTHDPLNLRLGVLFKIPRVVLLRRPFEAITAFAGLSIGQASVEECARRYIDFHRAVAKMDHFLVAEYALVVEDVNAVIARLNERLPGDKLAFSADVEADIERARERRRERLRATNRSDMSAAERAEAEARVVDAVREFLSRDQEAEGLYELVLSRG